MITTLVSYLSHSQIWALQQEGLLHVGGRTNRATLAFAGELSNILDAVPDRCTGQSRNQGTSPNGQAATDETGVFVPVDWQQKPAERSPSRSDTVPDDAIGNLNGGSIGFASVDEG